MINGITGKAIENYTIKEKISICALIKEGHCVKNEDGIASVYLLGSAGRAVVTEVSNDIYEKYCKYAEKPWEYCYTKLEKIIDVIAKNSYELITMRDWFYKILEKCNIWLYSELTEEQKCAYAEQKYNDVSTFRGCCMRKDIFKLQQKDTPYSELKFNIFIHDQNETIESAAWVLLHELGHAQMSLDSFSKGVSGTITHMNYLQEAKYKDISYADYFTLYNTSDEVHEERPEEIYCNIIANTWIGKKLDRYWWRKNMAPKGE